jgi:hypothetical protein
MCLRQWRVSCARLLSWLAVSVSRSACACVIGGFLGVAVTRTTRDLQTGVVRLRESVPANDAGCSCRRAVIFSHGSDFSHGMSERRRPKESRRISTAEAYILYYEVPPPQSSLRLKLILVYETVANIRTIHELCMVESDIYCKLYGG